MKELPTFKQPDKVNADRLHEELVAALGSKYDSVDTGVKFTRDDKEPKILVRVSDDATADDTAIVESVIAAHKPDALSVEQQRMKDRADSHTHFVGFDFAALREMKPAEQTPIIIDLLEDIQRIMRGVG